MTCKVNLYKVFYSNITSKLLSNMFAIYVYITYLVYFFLVPPFSFDMFVRTVFCGDSVFYNEN